MRSKVSSDWLPSYVKATGSVLKMDGYLPDSPRTSWIVVLRGCAEVLPAFLDDMPLSMEVAIAFIYCNLRNLPAREKRDRIGTKLCIYVGGSFSIYSIWRSSESPAFLASNVTALSLELPSSSEGERDLALGSIRSSVSFTSSSDSATFSTSTVSSGLNNFQYAVRCKDSSRRGATKSNR